MKQIVEMQTYNKNQNTPMLNNAILELNGVFNINRQRRSTATVAEPLKPIATAKDEYVTPVITAEDFKKNHGKLP